MRRHRLILVPLTALAALGLAAPSLAADVNVNVVNFAFQPKSQNVAVGDRVVWGFEDEGHTSTSLPGQPQRWDSEVRDVGETFAVTFSKPGRYQYLCTPHDTFMKGTITVGEDSVRKSAGAISAKVAGKQVTVGFRLKEAAKATLALKGASKRTVTRKRLRTGKRSIVVKRLKAGSYTATLTLLDDFDKRTVRKKSFQVR